MPTIGLKVSGSGQFRREFVLTISVYATEYESPALFRPWTGGDLT